MFCRLGQLLSLNETVFVCVTRTEHTSDIQQRTRLVASASFDWRTTLSRTQSQVRQTVSLTGTHSLSTLPFGLLDLTCVVSPALALPLSIDALAAQLDLERASHSDSERYSNGCMCVCVCVCGWHDLTNTKTYAFFLRLFPCTFA